MKKLIFLLALVILVSPVFAGAKWTYGYTSKRGLFSDYYSTYGFHAAKVKDLRDGSYEFESTTKSGKKVYTDTPSSSRWKGQFSRYE